MSATTAAPMTLDISGTAPTPFTRLLRTELRKTYDTRSGLWLLISIGIVTALVMVIQVSVAIAQDIQVSYNDFLTSTTFSIGFLLPVLGILLLTSEWSQRTAMVSFSLEPRRAHVIAAKLVVGVLFAVAAVVVTLLLAALCTAAFNAISDIPADWDFGIKRTSFFLLLQVIGMLTGFAFAALLLNSPAAIVVYFAYSFILPTIFGIGAELIGWFADIHPWIDFNNAQVPLIDGSVTGEEWAQLLVSGVIWLVIPLSVGIWRVLRAEVK
ncbi:ABC transporter permease [Nocardioides caricicola]|uniref:ABC transporter permease n=1 Tax=Nocardioides caricicola TaxID=634770 RepID=A0ABW0N758_9ACTN